jgi:hypothetical protein
MKSLFPIFLFATSFYLQGCADIPDTDGIQEQQLQRSYAAPGQPIKVPDVPEDRAPAPVPGE